MVSFLLLFFYILTCKMWLHPCNKKSVYFLDVAGTVYQVFVDFYYISKFSSDIYSCFFRTGYIICDPLRENVPKRSDKICSDLPIKAL